MLNAMRKRVSSFFVTILMGLLIASFAIWGIGDVFRFGAGNAIATVGETNITPQAYAREFQNEVSRWQQRFGSEFTVSQAREIGLHRQVLARMISRVSFDEAAQQLGLRASDAQVRDYIAGNEAFRNSLGEFDKMIYEDVLRRIGYTVATFEEASRDDLTREQLLSAVGTAAYVPDDLATLLYTYRAEKRVADVLEVKPASITDVPAPTDDELRAYYDENGQQFMAPEYRSLSYVMVTADDLAKGVQVTDQDIQDYYETHLDDYVTPEHRVVEQIVLFDEEEANDAYQAIVGGEDFLAVAKRTSGLTADDVKLGELTQQELAEDVSPAAASRVFETAAGKVTEPQQSAFGWHLIRTTSVIPGKRTELADVRDQVEQLTKREAAIDDLFDMINAMEDELARGGSLIEVASIAGVGVTPVEAVDRTGLTPEGKKSPLVPDVPGFLREAFTLEPNAEPLVREAGAAGYYILSVDGVTPSTIKPFEDVREVVEANWTVDKRRQLARARADSLAEAAKSSDLKTILGKDADRLQQDVTIVRDPAFGNAEISAEVRHTAFVTAPGDIAVSETADGSGFLVIKVKSRTPGNADAGAENLNLLKQALVQQYGNDVLGAYQGYLQRSLGLTVNEKLLEDTLSQLADRSI